MFAPRKRRPQRPSILHLEALTGASSLVPGALPAVAATVAAANVGQLAPAQPARDSSAIPATPVVHHRPTGEVRQPLPSRPPVEPTITPTAATPALPIGATFIATPSRPNSIAITPPIVIPASTGGTAQPKTYGGAGVIRPMSLVLAPSAQPQQAASPQTNAAVVENTTNPTGGTSGGGTSGGGTSGGTSGGGDSGGDGGDSGVDHTGWHIHITGGTSSYLPGNPIIEGLHPGDGEDAPLVQQGALWSGGVELLDPDGDGETNPQGYQIENYTWSFPNGVLKGYGTFAEEQERPNDPDDPGTYTVLTGNPTASGTATTDQQNSSLGFTYDDRNFEASFDANPDAEDNDHVANSFHWGPQCVGEQTVSVEATFVKLDGDADIVDSFEGDDQVTFDVLRPQEGASTVGNLGVPGVSPQGVDDDNQTQQWVQTAWNHMRSPAPDPADPRLGIQYATTVNNPDGLLTGVFGNIQTMTTDRVQRYINTANQTVAWRNAPDAQLTKVLDAFGGSPLYSGRVNTAEVGPNVPKVSSTSAGNYLYGLDNPGSPISFRGDAKTPLTFARSDRFTVTVTDNPDPNATMDNGGGAPASIWIPVGTFNWWWGAAAAYNTNSQTYANAWDPTRGATPYSDTTYFPTWTSNIRAQDSMWKQLQ